MPELRHSSDREPGFTRVRRGKGFSYHDEQGNRVEDPAVLDRLKSLAIPPAYDQVWFCKDEQGHVQATGVDDRGRKQYRYHDDFRALAEAAKFDRCAEFGRALPHIRKTLARQLRRRKLTRETVLAAVLSLIDNSLIRVGNEQYARANGSFGATTLRTRHVNRLKTRLKVNFKGKHGTERNVTIAEPALVRILSDCHDLPGQQLFQYLDGDTVRGIGSADVNAYLQEISGSDFTAKQFRTWGASALAMEKMTDALKAGEPLTLKSIVEPVAEALGNTPSVTRGSYIHPDLIDAVKDSPLDPFTGKTLPARKRKHLSLAETQLIAFLDPGGKLPRRHLRDLLRLRRG
ncbi:DNA topoisomerase IB [Sphingomicrobium flavum]|uniref:DNA topoisomerase IB n=1 Tax=Sphingomicrobium flavum TaxID=1229164 RepID=UPI0021ADA50F|nr:DNA topoisomerase IB [Sphingomicrobium flavum]